jgi:hypothetical protein
VNVASGGRIACAALLGVLVVVSGRTGQARTVAATAQLDYAAAAGCPTADEFEAVVDGRLGYQAFRADAPDRVVVRIEWSRHALEGSLDWQHAAGGAIGERTFPSRTGDCNELARAMAFALAVQLQLMAATAPDERTAPPAATPPPAQAPPPPAIVPPPPSPARATAEHDGQEANRRRWVSVGAGAAAGLGIARDPVALGRLFVTLGWPHVALELEGEASLPSTIRRADGAGFSQFQVLAGLAGCGVRGAFSACAVGKAGEFRVTGQNVDVPATDAGLMVQAGLRLAAAHTFGHRVDIIGRAEGLARLTQGTVTLDSMSVWRTPRFAGLLGIDFAIRFK